MKKAAILTVWDAPNYGSFLQAVAMSSFLKQNGYEVELIRYRSKIRALLFLFEKKKQLLLHPIFSIKRAKKFLDAHRTVKTISINKLQKKAYDLIIIGSDEIWNVKNDPYFSKGYFYGDGFEKEKTLVYSTSVGTSQLEDLLRDHVISKNIRLLDSNRVTARDEKTASIIKAITGKKVMITCDPTFLIKKEIYGKHYDMKLPQRYMVIYSYRITESLKNRIIKFAKDNNLKTISLCNYYDFCDYNIACSPLEFSDIIGGAEFTVVTTFHGTIYSVLNHKQFICISKMQKTKDILSKIGLSDRLIDSNDYDGTGDSFDRILKAKINYNLVEDKIRKYRDNSVEWLIEKVDK